MHKLIAATVAVLMIAASSVTLANTGKSATPEQVVSSLIAAMEANDATTIRSLFAEDASQQYERWYARAKSGDKFRAWLESDIIDAHGRVADAQLNANGAEVVVTGTYRNNQNYQSAADFLLVVEAGKIVSWTMRYD